MSDYQFNNMTHLDIYDICNAFIELFLAFYFNN